MPEFSSLKKEPLPFLLAELFNSRFTGSLLLREQDDGEGEKRLHFSDGSPVCVETDILEETLGYFLVDTGVLSDDERQQYLLQGLDQHKDLGTILIEASRLSPTQLFRSMRENFVASILKVFGWSDGEYYCQAGAKLPPRALTVKMRVHELILRGVEEEMPDEVLQKSFPILPEDRFVVTNRDSYNLSEHPNSADIERLLAHLYQPMTFEELAKKVRFNRGWLQRILCALTVIETVSKEDDAPRAADPILFGAAMSDVNTEYIVGTERQDHVGPDVEQESASSSPSAATAGMPAPVVADTNGKTAAGTAEVLEQRIDQLLQKYLKFRSQTFFDLFEIPWSSTEREVHDGYLRFIRHYHPYGIPRSNYREIVDKAEELMCEAAKAYAVLSTPELRRSYLLKIVNDRKSQGIAHGDGAASTDLDADTDTTLGVQTSVEASREAEQSFRAGFQFLRQQRHEAAFEMFQLAADLDPSKPTYRAFVGFSNFLMAPEENWQVGYTMVNEALAADMQLEALWLLKARMLVKHGDVEEAQQCMQEGSKQLPESATLTHELEKITDLLSEEA